MSGPKVSVCIPNYNYGEFLEKAVESALTQSWRDVEVIVIDDASTDDSLSRLRRFRDGRLRIYRNERRLGRASNINRGFSLATGEYVTLVPSDAVLLPQALEKRIEVLEKYERAVLVHCGVLFIDERDQAVGRYVRFERAYVRSGVEELRQLVRGNYIYPVSAVMRTRCVRLLGGLDESVAPSHRDWHLFLRMATMGDFAYVPEMLVAERRHGGNFTEAIAGTELPGLASYLVLRRFFEELRENSSELACWESYAFRELAIRQLVRCGQFLVRGDVHLARKYLGLSVMCRPGIVWDPRFWGLCCLSVLPWSLVKGMPYGIARWCAGIVFGVETGEGTGITRGVGQAGRKARRGGEPPPCSGAPREGA